MKQKRSRPLRTESTPERDDVRASRNRCPFCHDGIAAADEDWLICERCLARHHEACWGEAGSCSSCGSSRRLRRRRARLKRKTGAPALPVLVAGALAMLALLVSAALIHSNNERARRIDEARLARAREAAAQLTADELERVRRRHEEELRQAALDRMVLADSVRLDPETERQWEAEVLAGRERQRLKAEETLRSQQIEDLMRSAKRHYQRQNYARAVDRYKSVLALDPGNASTHHSLGAVHLRLGDYGAAIAGCTRALELRPRYAVALVTRGTAQRLAGDARAALADYDAALAIEPMQLEALCNRGVVKRHLGQLTEALADFDQALRLFPDDAATHLNRGEALAAQGRTAEALDAYARFYAVAPAAHPQLDPVASVLLEAGRGLPLRGGDLQLYEPGGSPGVGVLSFDDEDDGEGGQGHEALAREPAALTGAAEPSGAGAQAARPGRRSRDRDTFLGLARAAASGRSPGAIGIR